MMIRSTVVVAFILTCVPSPLNAEDGPRALDSRLSIRLFAESPQIVTPTGLDVDEHGRVWVIESNTHFPPQDYNRHPSDRVLVMSDADDDGRADRVLQFDDGLRHAMSVAVRPDGTVYVVTRKEIYRYPRRRNLYQDRGQRKQIMFLDTPGDYPHNGLAGLAFDALGWMYFGLGENLGAEYTLVGRDGTRLSGGGEGGNLYRCRLDGSQLTRFATGFWNPHASCVDAFGRMFTVDNDPDSRPPCRLLHIIPDGDYGYRFRNGRRGVHPFTAWDGEIPGTLPMVAGTGEAPSGIVAYESDGLPEDYQGNLLVTSWGDHRIDRYHLRNQGTSFVSVAEPVVVGGEDFRPVGLAVAPDGSLFLSDWVLKDYQLHGRGRVWRIAAAGTERRADDDGAQQRVDPGEAAEDLLQSRRITMRRRTARMLSQTRAGRERLRTLLADEGMPPRPRIEALWALFRFEDDASDQPLEGIPQLARSNDEVAAALCQLRTDNAEIDGTIELLRDPSRADPQFPLMQFRRISSSSDGDDLSALFDEALDLADPFVFRTALVTAGRCFDEKQLARLAAPRDGVSARARLGYVLAARERNPALSEVVRHALIDPDPQIRWTAVQWIGEERLAEFKQDLRDLLAHGAETTQLFHAVLASLELLDGTTRAPGQEWDGSQYVWSLLSDSRQSDSVRARALRMFPPNDPRLNVELFRQMLADRDSDLSREAVRTLQHSPLPEAPELLQLVAEDGRYDVESRADAVSGLAATVGGPAADETLKFLYATLLADEPVLQTEAARALRGVATKSVQVRAKLRETAQALEGRLQADPSREDVVYGQLALALSSEDRLPAVLEARRSQRPKRIEEWLPLLQTPGDPQAGRRVFFDPNAAGCVRCHTVGGRGGRLGPDLSVVARSMNRNKLVESILEPSKEIAPQFVTWSVRTVDGLIYDGLLLDEDSRGHVSLGLSDGRVVEIPSDTIEERKTQTRSVMPDNLTEQLTIEDFRNLLAFLVQLK